MGAVVRMNKRNRFTHHLEQIKLDVKQGTESINGGYERQAWGKP